MVVYVSKSRPPFFYTDNYNSIPNH